VSTDVPSSVVDVPSWVDRALPAGARAAVLWAPAPGWSKQRVIDREDALWRAEFFNDSVGDFYYVQSEMNYGLPEQQASLRGGRLVLPPGSTAVRYVLTTSNASIPGDPMGLDVQAGLVLYRLDRPAEVER
jgi:hypothetical protein